MSGAIFASKASRSLPTRERGLKYSLRLAIPLPPSVAPYTGAWIEIFVAKSIAEGFQSLPTRERGLKSPIRHRETSKSWSLPTRERGLKYPAGRCPYRNWGSLPTRERGLK
ncbi:hypothetical protein [Caproicibacterium sp. XB2]|uniref:hypothetical protein n=1 Tax=Caproicibacterium sp. XB2 TaxID=3388458 RepID=UPI00384F3A67